MQTRFETLANKFGTMAEARGYASELNFAIGNPEEEGLDENQVHAAKLIVSEIREYLAMGDEAL